MFYLISAQTTILSINFFTNLLELNIEYSITAAERVCGIFIRLSFTCTDPYMLNMEYK